MIFLQIIPIIIAAQIFFLPNLYAKTYLGVTLPFHSYASALCPDKEDGYSNNRFEGKCVDPKYPSEFGGYSIYFGSLNFGLFHIIKELRYGSEKTFEWEMKSELTGIYFGFYHSYGWNFVTGLGEGRSVLTTKEKSIYENSGETKTNRIRHLPPRATEYSDCNLECMVFFKFGWPLSESLQLLFQVTSLTFRDPLTGYNQQLLYITDEEYQKRGSRKQDRFDTYHSFYNIGFAYNVF